MADWLASFSEAAASIPQSRRSRGIRRLANDRNCHRIRFVHATGMALFGLVFLSVALFLVGIGIAVGLVGCGIAAALVGLGVVSSSVAIGIRSGRPAAGIRAFLIQCGLFAGAPAGVVCALIGRALYQAYGGGWAVPVYGAIGGAFSGVLVACLFDFIAKKLHRWAAARLHSSQVLPQNTALPSSHS